MHCVLAVTAMLPAYVLLLDTWHSLIATRESATPLPPLQASNKDIIASYTKFYQLLMLSGYDDWRDYVLDQILLARCVCMWCGGGDDPAATQVLPQAHVTKTLYSPGAPPQ
jgi:hypothetical protein